MLEKAEYSNDPDVVTNIFSKKEKQVVFVPTGRADDFTDPSYHLPHFYELWACWDTVYSEFWSDAASTSREYWKKSVHPVTGLAPDYSKFDGTPFAPWGDHDKFQYDAWRVAMNIAMDYVWFARDEWAVEQSNRILNFFYSLGVKDYGHRFTLDGRQLSDDHSTGLVAMNSVACLASTNKNRREFLEDFWNVSIPTGRYRYYDGMLYMLGLLQVSGNFQIYNFQ
jgi:oligosaccharide reducing-end xylanase